MPTLDLGPASCQSGVRRPYTWPATVIRVNGKRREAVERTANGPTRQAAVLQLMKSYRNARLMVFGPIVIEVEG